MDDIIMKMFGIFIGLLLILFFVSIIGVIIDSIYTQPMASEKANKFCMQMGFDFYEGYERIGLFSTTPVAIKCKYVEQYRKLDGNLDVNIRKT